jgi:hypothetical protein
VLRGNAPYEFDIIVKRRVRYPARVTHQNLKHPKYPKEAEYHNPYPNLGDKFPPE